MFYRVIILLFGKMVRPEGRWKADGLTQFWDGGSFV